MSYIKKEITEADLDRMRIALSVRSLKLRPEPSCDFCGSTEPKFVYAAVRLSTGEFVANWRWCACADCSQAVDADNWKLIEDKLIKWLRPKFPGVTKGKLRIVAKRALLDFNLYAERQ
jgi:hypothetical protein